MTMSHLYVLYVLAEKRRCSGVVTPREENPEKGHGYPAREICMYMFDGALARHQPCTCIGGLIRG